MDGLTLEELERRMRFYVEGWRNLGRVPEGPTAIVLTPQLYKLFQGSEHHRWYGNAMEPWPLRCDGVPVYMQQGNDVAVRLLDGPVEELAFVVPGRELRTGPIWGWAAGVV